MRNSSTDLRWQLGEAVDDVHKLAQRLETAARLAIEVTEDKPRFTAVEVRDALMTALTDGHGIKWASGDWYYDGSMSDLADAVVNKLTGGKNE